MGRKEMAEISRQLDAQRKAALDAKRDAMAELSRQLDAKRAARLK